jgi:DNA repair exonuclease SbcCD nuclease subunit
MDLKDVKILGDPHLGRRFKTGVPLHRAGHREAMQWAEFISSLNDGPEPLHVCMGDIFDSHTVPAELILRVAQAYREAANTGLRQFVILRGNHDASRNADRRSSFDILTALLADLGQDVRIVGDKPRIIHGFGFIGWHPFKTAAELAEELVQFSGGGWPLTAVFGHWDVDAFGDDHNLIPEAELFRNTPTILTGHIHLPTTFNRLGVEVIVTGSMQPYSHAEDPTGRLYRTVTLEQLAEISDEDRLMLNLRVILQTEEELPQDIDCLSLVGMRVDADFDVNMIEGDEFQKLEVQGLMQQRLHEASIPPEVIQEILKAFSDQRVKE